MFEHIYNRIARREDVLFLNTVIFKVLYSKENFRKILLKYNLCVKTLETIEKKYLINVDDMFPRTDKLGKVLEKR